MVETRNGSDLVIKQNVWGLTYIDELVQTSLNDDPADLTEQLCESNFYAMQDANYNVLGMVDTTGILIERYEYTPYGQRQVYTSSGLNDPLCYAPISTSKRWQISGIAQPYSLNPTGHQGLYHDEEINLIYNRARYRKGPSFFQRDPLGYVDGMSLYQYVKSNPINFLDAFGLQCGECTPGKVQIFSARPIPTQVGRRPGEIDKKMQGLLDILNAAESLNMNPWDAVKKFPKLAGDIFGNGVEEVAGDILSNKIKDYLKNEIGLSGLPTDPLSMTIGEVRGVVDNFLNKLKQNRHNVYMIVRYRICSCCCRAKNQGEWGGRQTEEEKVWQNGIDVFSTVNGFPPDFKDEQNAYNKIASRIAKKSEMGKCN